MSYRNSQDLCIKDTLLKFKVIMDIYLYICKFTADKFCKLVNLVIRRKNELKLNDGWDSLSIIRIDLGNPSEKGIT